MVAHLSESFLYIISRNELSAVIQTYPGYSADSSLTHFAYFFVSVELYIYALDIYIFKSEARYY